MPVSAHIRLLALTIVLAVPVAGPALAASPSAEAAAAALPATVVAGPKGKTSEDLRHNVTQAVTGEGMAMMAQASAGYTIINDPEKLDTTGVSIDVQIITAEMAQMSALPPGVVPTQTSDSPNNCHDRTRQVGTGMVTEHWCDGDAPSAEYAIRSGTAYVTVSVSNGSLADARTIAESVYAAASGEGA